jgi:hypothetical protein
MSEKGVKMGGNYSQNIRFSKRCFADAVMFGNLHKEFCAVL